jgi:hypothetical protein
MNTFRLNTVKHNAYFRKFVPVCQPVIPVESPTLYLSRTCFVTVQIERIMEKSPISQLCFLFLKFILVSNCFFVQYIITNITPRRGIRTLFNILIVHFAIKFKFCFTCISVKDEYWKLVPI